MGADPARQVSYSYNDGFLTGVPTFATEITYHANGALSHVMHANSTTDTVGLDPNWLPRPEHLSVTGPDGTTLWDTGPYTFDGSGNIQAIGTDTYAYDRVGRLLQASVAEGATTTTETYTYDHFGNLTSLGTAGNTRTYAIEAQTNRLDDPAYTYDPAGNLTASPSGTFTYDAFNMVTTATGTGKNEHYLYTADDERIAQLDLQTQPPSLEWTLRGLDQKVLRTYASDLPTGQQRATWTWEEDYIYRGSSLLATTKSSAPNQPEHFHLDHLGTPRLRTSSTGTLLSHHKYLPYGEELTDPSLNPETMRFTGHERDVDPAGWENDLDYMHARYYSPRMGRFLTVDPVGGKVGSLQSWNRYAYVMGNPESGASESEESSSQIKAENRR